MKKYFLQAAAAACLFSAACSPAQALVIGKEDSESSIPFGTSGYSYFFQQIYSAASFASAININEISFYQSSTTPGSTPRPGAFQIYLSTSSANVGAFDTNTSQAWLDDSFTKVFDGILPVLADGRLDFDLSTTFNYNPSAGNLLLTVRAVDLTDGSLYLQADKNNGTSNIRFSAYPYDFNQGLVTGFNESAVPEPATWAMMIAGFGIVGGSMRRRRHVTTYSVA